MVWLHKDIHKIAVPNTLSSDNVFYLIFLDTAYTSSSAQIWVSPDY
jgi:hypothetical protein